MNADRMTPARERADIRAEIARRQQRETTLDALEHRCAVVPMVWRGWPMQRRPPAAAKGAHA